MYIAICHRDEKSTHKNRKKVHTVTIIHSVEETEVHHSVQMCAETGQD